MGNYGNRPRSPAGPQNRSMPKPVRPGSSSDYHRPPQSAPRRAGHSAPPARPDKNEEQIRAQRRAKGIKRSSSLVAGIFFVFALIYLLRSFYAFLSAPHTATEVVRMGATERQQAISGVIIRDEQVYRAGKEGRVVFNVSDYERVKPGKVICNIQDAAAFDDITRSMESVEEQIMSLQWLKESQSDIDPAVKRVNEQIKNIVDSSMFSFTSMNIVDLYALKERISQNINNRNQMIINDNKNTKAELSFQQQQLQSRLGSYTSVMTAARGGIMSPVVDGFEEVFSPGTMKELTREKTQMRVDYDAIITQKDVQADAPVFKIIFNNIWYIAAYVPSEQTEGLADGDRITVFLEMKDEFIPMDVQIEQIDRQYRDCFVIFKCGKYMIDFLPMRNVTIKMADYMSRGLKISNSAIVTREYFAVPSAYINKLGAQSFVYRQAGVGNESVPVTVLNQDASYAYTTGFLSVGDTLAMHDDVSAETYQLTESMTEQGVFRANNGCAEFRKIAVDENALQTGTYTILSASVAQGIKEYDYIVSDAFGITEGQILR